MNESGGNDCDEREIDDFGVLSKNEWAKKFDKWKKFRLVGYSDDIDGRFQTIGKRFTGNGYGS